ncbi:alpha/beta fold hydrolase [Sandaracinobacteroides sayramensis]|uniref:alpha/beta fold hydrolase n=1 Tax=Sandaracinobacteroides sayramensis TaxID=2913411 RepID=UPI00210346F9|nr:alpha/beta hydrolase [Sandaracinobacteroides sayramensis]
MIQTQPVAAELPDLRAPLTLIIGQTDRTAFRGATAPVGIRPRTVPQAAEIAVHRVRNATLVRLPELGHSPQVEDPGRFLRILFETLAE